MHLIHDVIGRDRAGLDAHGIAGAGRKLAHPVPDAVG
jgi:hypothetical protein